MAINPKTFNIILNNERQWHYSPFTVLDRHKQFLCCCIYYVTCCHFRGKTEKCMYPKAATAAKKEGNLGVNSGLIGQFEYDHHDLSHFGGHCFAISFIATTPSPSFHSASSLYNICYVSIPLSLGGIFKPCGLFFGPNMDFWLTPLPNHVDFSDTRTRNQLNMVKKIL